MTPGPTLPDFGREAQARVADGYYDTRRLPEFCPPRGVPSLRAALTEPRGTFPVIAEVKPASPTRGAMRADADAAALAGTFVDAGARAVSVLVEDKRFGGSPENVMRAAAAGAPVLWKDFVVSVEQLRAARRLGASAVLLILDLHESGGADADVDAFIERAHAWDLEVLLEVYDERGLARALDTRADVIGINNRDLRAPGLPVDVATTPRVIASALGRIDRPVLALSGIESRRHLEAAVTGGAAGALIGSVLMEAKDPAEKLRELIC